MSWLRIEGRMPQHRKIAPLSDAAFRLHVTAKAWCVEEQTDGEIPKSIPPTLTAAPRGRVLTATLAELEAAGLWEATETGYRVHDFLDYNPSKAESEALAAARSAAGAAGGRSSGKARAKQTGSKVEASAEAIAQANAKQNSTPIPIPIPIPIPENPTGSPVGEPDKPAAPKPKRPRRDLKPVSEWAGPTERHRQFAAQHGLDVDAQEEKARNWALADGQMKVDWDAFFSNWLGKAVEFAKRDERSSTQIRSAPRQRDWMLERVQRIDAEERAENARRLEVVR